MKALKFKTRLAITFFLLSAAVSSYLVSFAYTRAVTLQMDQLRTRLMQFAALSSEVVGGQETARLVPSKMDMDMREYKDLVSKLRRIKSIHQDIADVYILVPTADPGKMKFVANADEEQVIDCGEEYDATRFPELMKASGGPTADKEITTDRWGAWLSGYAPLRDGEGRTIGILGVDISAQTVSGLVKQIRDRAVMVFIATLIFAVLAANLASWWLTKPLKNIVNGMEQVSKGDLDHMIEIGADDELGAVARNFNRMAAELKKYIAELMETTKERERLNKELEIAAELQQAMLPHYDINIEGIDIAGMSLPAKQVGGDYFDYIDQEGRNIGFVIADATGKGLNSSIFMTNSKSIFKVITTGESSPGKVIQKTNDLVVKDVSDAAAMFVTLFYGIYDREKEIFRYSNAGHNPPIFFDRSENKVKVLNVHGVPIGIMEDQVYGDDEFKLDKGDSILLYTDGVVEMMNAEQEMFGLSGFIKAFMEVKDLPAKEMLAALKEKVFAFSGTRPQFDDFTLLIFKVK
ncbi:MAG: SpoIIE family protein phosphatase [Candidatus Omnitrophica bacterium]|nr:SpoIIE family protein phosphatase [Candidatus Omnitrophota bacterium]MDD4013549.1 SpoIIE family protein phosphatase [Candidatus Omnitrophota bacterium]